MIIEGIHETAKLSVLPCPVFLFVLAVINKDCSLRGQFALSRFEGFSGMQY